MNLLKYLCSALVWVLISACGGADQPAADDVPVLPIVSPVLKDTADAHIYVANLMAYKNVEIRVRVRGVLEHTYVEEGQYVHKGQLLFKIVNDELNISLENARSAVSSAVADAKAAEIERNRTRMLVAQKAIAASEYQLADERYRALKAKVDQAKALVSSIARRINYTGITAPFSGYIDRMPIKVGSLVDEGALLTTLSDNSRMYAYFNLSENEYLNFIRDRARGVNFYADNATLKLTDGSVYNQKGKIEPAESEIDRSTGSIAFRAVFSNPDNILRHGASGSLLLNVALDNVLLIPQKCVFEIQDKHYVFAVDDSSRVHQQSFEPGVKLGRYIVVASGLSPTDKIVYEGIQNIRDGMKVAIRK